MPLPIDTYRYQLRGDPPRKTKRSISPGREAIDASPAAPAPMLPPTIEKETVFCVPATPASNNITIKTIRVRTLQMYHCAMKGD